MRKIGLTGSIGVGKSTVVEILRELGAICFDADVIAREVVAPGTPGLAAVVAEFGAGVLDDDGALDRSALGRIVFGDAAKRARLEAILHPTIIAEQDRLVSEALERDPNAIVVVDAALMIESGSFRRFDAIVVVHCDPAVQLERVMRRSGWSADEARSRIAAQMSQAEKRAFADFEIDTSGTLDDTRARTEVVWRALRAS